MNLLVSAAEQKEKEVNQNLSGNGWLLGTSVDLHTSNNVVRTFFLKKSIQGPGLNMPHYSAQPSKQVPKMCVFGAQNFITLIKYDLLSY